MDYVIGYQSYLNNLQAAGLVSGVTYSSNQYGGLVVSIPGAGEMIGGDQYNDGLPVTDLDDVVIGFNGADLFATSNGQDRCYGLGGRDMVDYVNETAGIVVQIGVDTDITRNWEPLVARGRMLQFVQDEHSAQDVLIDVEVVLGSSYVDMLEITTTEGWSLASENHCTRRNADSGCRRGRLYRPFLRKLCILRRRNRSRRPDSRSDPADHHRARRRQQTRWRRRLWFDVGRCEFTDGG